MPYAEVTLVHRIGKHALARIGDLLVFVEVAPEIAVFVGDVITRSVGASIHALLTTDACLFVDDHNAIVVDRRSPCRARLHTLGVFAHHA